MSATDDLFVKATEYGLWEDSEPVPVDELCQRIKDREAEEDYLKRQTVVERTKRKAKDAADAEEVKARVVSAIRGIDVIPAGKKWLWATDGGECRRIPLNRLTLLVGKGNVGKTTLECTWAAWITKGEMHGYYGGQPKDVLFVVYEDDISEDMAPLLISAGADMKRVHFLTMEQLGHHDRKEVLLPTDCDAVAAYAKSVGAVVVFIDPISAALRVDNTNDAKKMRSALQGIAQMAMTAFLTVIGVAHTRKAAATSLIDAIMGSVEMGNVARAVVGLMEDEDVPGTIVMSQEKVKAPLRIPGYRYKIVGHDFPAHDGQVIRSSKLEFVEKVDAQRVSEMMREQATAGVTVKTAIDAAWEGIREYLTDPKIGGEALRSEVIRALRAEGHNDRAIEKAAARYHVVSRPSGDGAKRIWGLPPNFASNDPSVSKSGIGK